MKQSATITLNDAAILQIADALVPHLERLLQEQFSKKETALHGGPRLLRQPQVTEITGLRRSALYRMVWDEKFPKPMKIGQRMVAWREDEVREWINKTALART